MTKEVLTYIFDTFQQEGNIDLKAVQRYFSGNKELKEKCKIFVVKLQNYLDNNREIKLSKDDFFSYFNRQITDPVHFGHVFKSIDADGSGFISKSELKRLVDDCRISLKEDELNMMIEVCSQDGQKIAKQDLYKFLLNNKQ